MSTGIVSGPLAELALHIRALEDRASAAERGREGALQEVGRLRARVEELEALPDPVLTFGVVDDQPGFVLFIDGEQVGEPVTYDDFGWAGIDLAKSLVLAVAKAFGSEVSDRG